MSDWYEDDEFWQTLAPIMFGQSRMDAAEEEVDHALALTGIEPPAAVLDMCCGPGRHSLEFAGRGCRVVGVDRTRSFLESAGEKARCAELDIEFVECDAREFSRPGSFDLAVSLFTSFGYFEDQDDDRQVARNLFESLKPGGKLVVELMGKEVLARIFLPRSWEECGDMTLLQERTVSDSWRWMDNRWILIRGTERWEFALGHRLYSADELCRLLDDVGFASTAAYGSLAGEPYDHEAKRLAVVAEKE
jgi:SAM-dependent methyltransferase